MENNQNMNLHKLGWIGAGRMGYAMAQRLLEKAESICLITASLKSETALTTDIRVD